MKILAALLLFSLGFNAYLLTRPRSFASSSAANPDLPNAAVVAAPSVSPSPFYSAPLPKWSHPSSEQEMQGFIAQLRAAGYPGTLVRAIAERMVADRLAAEDPDRGAPFWRIRMNQMDPARLKLQQERTRRREQMVEAMLGPDGMLATMDPAAREMQYGTLSDDRIRKIQEIERDYRELRAEQFAQMRGNAIFQGDPLQAKLQASEDARTAEIRAVLTPEEYEQYNMRTGRTTNQIVTAAKGLPLTDAEFYALYRDQEEFNSVHRTFTMTDLDQRSGDLDRLVTNARATLGDERIVPYLEGYDAGFNFISQLARRNNVTLTVDQSVELYRVQRDVFFASYRSDQTALPPSEIAELDRRLHAILGPAATRSFYATPQGQAFMRLANAKP